MLPVELTVETFGPLHTGGFVRSRADAIVNVLLAVASIFAIVSFTGRPTESGIATPDPADRELGEEDWRELRRLSRSDGDSLALVVVEFIDVECPFCARYAATLDSLTSSLPGQVSVEFIHFPLSQHRFARLGAQAIECARRQRRHHQLLAVVYQGQDSIGLKSFVDFARAAGVEDVQSFDECMNSSEDAQVIDEGVALARRIGATGTPTVVVNGTVFGQTPSLSDLVKMAELRGARVP